MDATAAAVVTLVVLAGWHMWLRRRPGWAASSAARTFIVSGYPMVAIAVYWLTVAPTGTHWEWAVGNAWALAAMVSFVRGFDLCDATLRRHRAVSESLETLPATPLDAR
jgi:hypothetical protein